MKTTNNTIFENIHERGYMTEKEMLLLKKRSNAAQHDLFNYDAELTRRRREKVEEMKKEFCVLFNQKYDNTSYWIDKDGNLTVRINTYEEALKKANWTKGRQFIVEV